MKFSIVISLYNKLTYITSTIESVLAQSFTDFEVIVVDDGSTDGGAELVAAIPDPRLRLVRQANAGVSAARNHGITHVRGEWVVFLDADDAHHPRFLESILAAQKVHPQADLVATGYMEVINSEDQWPPQWPAFPEPLSIELITDLPTRWMISPTLCTGSVAIRTDRLKTMQPCFAIGESYGEDMDLWFRLAEQTPVALVQAPMLAYRIAVPGSLTTHHTTFLLPPFLHRMRARALSGSLTEAQSRSALWFVAQQEVTLARSAIASGNRLEGLRCLARGRYAASGTRWWLTAIMSMLLPAPWVKNWELWRTRRTAVLVDAN
ncbi:MAG: glycosyltransferase family 2 protein [Polaromonas sp.]|nr:glycosyltransferase family 2 protein [Polaromonas sp.]